MMRSAKKTYEIDMLHGASSSSQLLRFAVPLTLSTMLQLLFNAADVVVVGRWAGDNSLAAVGSNTSLIALLTNMFLGLSIGANILAARYFGAHEDEELSKTVHTSILLSLYSGVFLTVVGILGARTILIWMQCWRWRRIACMSSISASAICSARSGAAASDARRPVCTCSVGVPSDAGYCSFLSSTPHAVVAGVALVTVYRCSSPLVRCVMKETGPLWLDFRQLKIYPIKLKRIIQVGIPAGIQGMLFSLANVTVQSSVNSFGEVIMAGSSAAISIEQFIYSNINAFYQANVAFTSQNYGAGDYRRIKKIARISVVTGVVTTELLSVLAVYFGPRLLGIYSPSAEVVAAGMVRLRWIALFFGLDAIMDVIVGSLRGVGYNILPMLVTLMGACASRLIWLSTVFRLPAYHRIEMVYIVYPLSWVLTATTHLICYFFVSRKVDRELRAHEAELAAPYGRKPGGSRLLSTFAKQAKKPAETSRFMFIGTQCDLWGSAGRDRAQKSVGEVPSTYFLLIPSLFAAPHFKCRMRRR